MRAQNSRCRKRRLPEQEPERAKVKKVTSQAMAGVGLHLGSHRKSENVVAQSVGKTDELRSCIARSHNEKDISYNSAIVSSQGLNIEVKFRYDPTILFTTQ